MATDLKLGHLLVAPILSKAKVEVEALGMVEVPGGDECLEIKNHESCVLPIPCASARSAHRRRSRLGAPSVPRPAWSAEACANLPRSCLKRLARRPLELAEMPLHDWLERHPPLREGGKAVERPRP